MKKEKADVTIIGAGAIGCAIAYFLSKEGLKVVVVEQDSIGAHASGFATGILSPLGVASESMEVMLPLITRSLQIHKKLSQRLPAETGIDYHFRQSALLRLAFTHAEVLEVKDEVNALLQHGFNVRWLDSNAVRLIESRVSSETKGAAYSEDAGEVDSYRYVLALAQAAEKYGAEIRHGRFTGLKRNGTKVTAIQLSSSEIACDCIVLAMGPWTGMASSSLGVLIPVGPQKGQTLRIRASGPPFTTMLAWDTHYNTTTRHDGLVYNGATHEDAGFDEEPTTEGRDKLINDLVNMVPSLVEAEVVLQTACLRPLSADGLPIIGEVPGRTGVYIATGHWKKGILLSPVTARIITELIVKGVTSIPAEPFALNRFIRS
jgi:glycine oxidase